MGDEISRELKFNYRIPQLILRWPAVASGKHHWGDMAGYGFDVLQLPGSRARRVVELMLGVAAVEQLIAQIAARWDLRTEEPHCEHRTWSRGVEAGFCPGDLEFVDTLMVTTRGVRANSYDHSYGNRGTETDQLVTSAQFLDPSCPLRATFKECLPRIDAYLQLLRDPAQPDAR